MPNDPCPSCLKALFKGTIRIEPVQPLPECPPLGLDGEPQCQDCASAGTLVRLEPCLTWSMARTAVANDRQEQYRLPGVPMGLVLAGITRPSAAGDLERHHEWLKTVGLWSDEGVS